MRQRADAFPSRPDVLARVRRAETTNLAYRGERVLWTEAVLVLRWRRLGTIRGQSRAEIFDRSGYLLASIWWQKAGQTTRVPSGDALVVFACTGEVLVSLRPLRQSDSHSLYEVLAIDSDGSEIGRADRGHLLSPWRLTIDRELVGTIQPWWRRSPRHWHDQGRRYDIHDRDQQSCGAIHAQPPGWQIIDVPSGATLTFRCLLLAASALVHLR
jgi:hypothetical protein